MSKEVEKYLELQDDLEELQKKKNKAQGALENIFSSLKRKYGIKTQKELTELIEKKDKELEKLEEELKEKNKEIQEIVHERLL